MADVTKIWAKSWQAPKGHKEQGKLSIDIVASTSEKAQIRIIGFMYSWWNGSDEFRYQVDWLKEQGYTWLDVYIHSGGGSAIEASEIVNILEAFQKDGGKVTGSGGALVASAATYIASKIEGFTQVPNGLYMIHKPSGTFEGNEDQISSSLRILQAITTDYANTYAVKTGMSVETVAALYEKGDYWMTAQEAADKKFIAGVTQDEEEYTMEDVNALRACHYPQVDQIAAQVKDTPPQNKNSNTNSNNHTEMDIKVLAVTLGLPADATEAQVNAKLAEQKRATEELETLRAEKQRKEGEEITAQVKSLLDTAVENKQITAAQRSNFEVLAKADFANTKNLIESLPKVKAISNQITEGNPEGGIEASRKDWAYKDWAEKDMPGLNAMMKNQPDSFKALYKAEYGIEASIPESN